MKILCQEHYDEIQQYANQIGDTSFNECIERLKRWEHNGSSGKIEIVLWRDFAPYSMMFEERCEDGRAGIRGGLIYHGDPDKSMSVQLVPKKGWSIHT